ncbi:Retrovirus-related Pol polyprotein from transposon RE1 [Vitis vinifera]|uniref:Retrovirus-related Pol polyprotein from transposon RE1 n=1 Tax=Vitis vinifera TaxID=29760 RepID=A0A438H555_VITVI|nr:Retrovirus-related Pol polyprotein from transposon RE1 [Vitis vinifera]
MLAAAPDHQDSWFFDTGATHHLVIHLKLSLVFSHIQVLIKSQLVIAIRYPFFTQDQVTKKILLKGWLGTVCMSSPPHLLLINKIAPCIICPLAKSHSLPYSLSSSHVSHPLALIHTDLWGPAPSISITGAATFLFSLMTIPGIPGFISFPPRTSFHVLIHPSKMEEQRGKFAILLKPVSLLWLKSPIQALFINFPTIIISESSVACVSILRPYTQHKLCYRSTACVFLGYAPAHNGYLCLDVSTSRIYISRNVIFHDPIFHFSLHFLHFHPSTPPFFYTCLNQFTQLVCSFITSSVLPYHHFGFYPSTNSGPLCHFLSSYPFTTSFTSQHSPMVTRAKSGIHKKRSFIVQHTTEPRTYSQASKNDSWVQAMNREYQALLRNNTWSLVTPPSSAHIVGCVGSTSSNIALMDPLTDTKLVWLPRVSPKLGDRLL